MNNISRWFFVVALLLVARVAHADGATSMTFQTPKGFDDGSVPASSCNRLTAQSLPANAKSYGFDSFGDPGLEPSLNAVQTYGDAGWPSLQFRSQPHSNWIARARHSQRGIVTAPEPSSLWMLSLGLLAVGFFSRRKVGKPLPGPNLV